MESKFNIDDYDFKIVEMDVFSELDSSRLINPSEFKNDNKIKYYLLVDEQNFIHDYKIQFEEIAFKNMTTKSHNNDQKKKTIAFKLRQTIFDEFKIKHEFTQNNRENKKTIYCFDINAIKKTKINKILWEDPNFSKITFQQIEYVLFGSNSSGQGSGRGGLFTKFNNKKTVFGIFLKTLNKNKVLRSEEYAYTNFSNLYKNVWENTKNTITFDEYINSSQLIKDFFVNLSSEMAKLNAIDEEWWKQIQQDFKNIIDPQFKNWEELNSKILKLRAKQKIEYKKWFNKELNIKQDKSDSFFVNESYKYFFNIHDNQIPSMFVYAHIFPVKKIKHLYLNEQNPEKKAKIIEQVASIFNFLPLPDDVHRYYDNKYFYWKSDGNIQFLEENKTLSNSDKENLLKNYSLINLCALENNERKKMLIKYLELIKQGK